MVHCCQLIICPDVCLNHIQCEAIRSEHFENDFFYTSITYEQQVSTSFDQKITLDMITDEYSSFSELRYDD